MHQPMHQSLSDESLLMSATQALNPLLKRALGVLDARLEDELARYRRYRAGKRVAPSAVSVIARGTKVKPGAKAAPQKLSLDLLQTVATPPKPIAPVTAEAPTAAIAPQATTQSTGTTPPPPPPRTPLSIQNQSIQNQPIQNESALTLTTDDGDTTVGQDAEGNSSSGSQAMLLSLEDFAAENDYQAGVDFGQFAADEAPNQYMESSEALLRSLAEEEATVAAERNVLEGLLTPMGVGSMLLMLLGSGMFGYLIMNPSSLTALKGLADKIANFRRPSAAAVATNGGGVDVDGADGGNVAWMSNAPALDSGEFLNLNLNNFSALRTRPGGSGLAGLTLLPTGKSGQSPSAQPLAQLSKADKKTAANQSKSGITGLTPLNIQPIVPPAPAIAGGAPSGGLFAGSPVRVSPGGGGSSGNSAPIYQPSSPRIEPVYEAPRRPARSYEPAYQAPARRYEAPARRYEAPARNYEPPAYTPPPAAVQELPPPPVETAPAAVEAQGEYRVVTPYTNDADLEAAQKVDSSASFRNLDDGAYIQRGGSYSSKAAAEAAAAKLQEQGVQAEVK